VRRDCTFKLRGQFFEAPSQLEGKTIELRFDPLDLCELEIYFQGEAQGLARPVDAVVNAQLPASKSAPALSPQPTGINFVELLEHKHQPPPGEQHDKHEEDKDKDKE